MASFQGENLLILLFVGLLLAAIIILSVIGGLVIYGVEQSARVLP
ncbi:hypothetical protein C7441_10910 [Pseudaminobacter salicylatoxidans]|uniref:Uncharacterized protein n=1 Tax=Pseudaminobacter salicylatoxidans TaxID=93369 RepID=A0A316C104_PSESE|nr:hypothetical protein C7441_10910 [Pseudaminobacter salicylatoxidans]